MKLPHLKCENCGYEWTPRVENPKKCPECGYRLVRGPKSNSVSVLTSTIHENTPEKKFAPSQEEAPR